MKIISQFLTIVRDYLFWRHVDREIRGRILPHLQQNKDHGYPFATDAQMKGRFGSSSVVQHLASVGHCTNALPTAYRDALHYIIYRDLTAHAARYERLLRRYYIRGGSANISG